MKTAVNPIPLDARALHLRRLVVRALAGGGRGHIGSALSLVEVLRVLYDDVLRFRPDEPGWPERDRLVFSKGHGCLALYAILADKGFFDADELTRFCKQESFLGGHPERGKVPGVEASTGALGHGFPIALGMAIAGRMKGASWRVFAVMGDGEIDEGSVWEAAMAAGKHRVANLTVVIDVNRVQSYGPTDVVQPLEPLADKWRAFGFETVEVDGHDVEALRRVFAGGPLAPDRPGAVICRTVKGRGIPFMENDPAWHHKTRVDGDLVAAMTAALEG